MQDKAALGTRYTCFDCGARFYDLNREVAKCPKCDSDQADNPNPDLIAALMSTKRPPSPRPAPKKEEAAEKEEGDDFNLDDDAAAPEDDE